MTTSIKYLVIQKRIVAVMKVVLGHALFIALRLTVTQHSTLEML